MGNSHTHTPRGDASAKKRLGRQRRLSEPEGEFDDNQLRPNRIKMSMSGAATPISTTPPRIQINGMESTEELEEQEKELSKSASLGPLRRSRSLAVFERMSTCNASESMASGVSVHSALSRLQVLCSTMATISLQMNVDLPSSTNANHSASLRRMQFLTSNSTTNVTARSLDDAHSIADLQLKPLSRAKSHSPLKQMRTYSYRSLSSEENALDKAACDLIKNSWNEATKAANATGRYFGYFVFQRVFQKDPSLKTAFGLKPNEDFSELPEDHECIRHTKIFTNIIHLAAKNVDELEPQVAPAIFKYGERHYNTKASDRMTEENVRMVCAQVVCTVCDLLGDDAHPKIVEAWIEMMRYLGRKLLDGFEYAKLTAKHRISINRNDHHLFLML
ncbi:GLOBIN domain-containing protein [Trichostrongylus colubriformis]|uniref:GLOBIN domain-containing protein n=1 Tax=Trichostrongylus colubriformis TaxID=6319 RepID=A0AAN8IST2_TRICO